MMNTDSASPAGGDVAAVQNYFRGLSPSEADACLLAYLDAVLSGRAGSAAAGYEFRGFRTGAHLQTGDVRRLFERVRSAYLDARRTLSAADVRLFARHAFASQALPAIATDAIGAELSWFQPAPMGGGEDTVVSVRNRLLLPVRDRIATLALLGTTVPNRYEPTITTTGDKAFDNLVDLYIMCKRTGGGMEPFLRGVADWFHETTKTYASLRRSFQRL